MAPKKRSRVPSKNFQKQVRSIVLDELKEELEEKTAVIGADATPITSNIPSGNVSASPNFVRLFPFVTQANSAKQYNGRVGNEIRLKNLNIKMLLQFPGPATLITNEASLGVRVMILKQKGTLDANAAIEDFQGDKLLENGAIVTPGPAPFVGDTINLFQKINRDQFSVRYDKTFYMTRPRSETRGSAPNGEFNERNYIDTPKPVFINKTLTFGKRGLKLTFGNGASDNPTNFPYFMVIGYSSTTQVIPISNNQMEYTYTANAKYTDA
jgi:hypothetical protein